MLLRNVLCAVISVMLISSVAHASEANRGKGIDFDAVRRDSARNLQLLLEQREGEQAARAQREREARYAAIIAQWARERAAEPRPAWQR